MIANLDLSWVVALPFFCQLAGPPQPASPLLALPASGATAACLADPAAGWGSGSTDRPTMALPNAPAAVQPRTPTPSSSMNWGRLGSDGARFLVVMHAFRWATEPGTRAAGSGLGRGYLRSVTSLHGWADGDPFYVNYVGHPMQGAVAGSLFALNDRRFNRVEFGAGREYWKGKLRAAAFAWAFSEQFEIGPLSEASIGHIQARFPQQGFVDHVVTPTFGLGWMIGEDALDRFVIRRIEDSTTNRWLRLALRTGLNPARSFANLVDGRAPWNRTSREGILTYRGSPRRTAAVAGTSRSEPPKPAPLEFTIASGWRRIGDDDCVGGGAEAAFRASPTLQVVGTVNGCKMTGLPTNVSGDALVYQAGPRWTPAPEARWSPFIQLLVGGIKVTREELFPEKKAALEASQQDQDPFLSYTLHSQYTRQESADALAISAAAGIDYKLNSAVAFRVANLEFLRANPGGQTHGTGVQFASGIVLRIGTW